VAGKDLRLDAHAYGNRLPIHEKTGDVYKQGKLNEAYLFNQRNQLPELHIAVTCPDKIIYTYMGTLKPNVGNANYCSAGQLSPLLKIHI